MELRHIFEVTYLLSDKLTIQAMAIMFYCASEFINILESSVAVGTTLS